MRIRYEEFRFCVDDIRIVKREGRENFENESVEWNEIGKPRLSSVKYQI